MRILMASKRAPGTPGRRDGGVQTWVSTVAAELRRVGHEVDVMPAAAAVSPGYGLRKRAPYDMGIFANSRYTAPLTAYCDASVLVCHGIVDDEAPSQQFDVTAFTSEEVRDHWKGDGPIIRQPIDLDFWSPGNCRDGKTLVRYANRGGLEWLGAVADKMGLQYQHLRNVSHEQAREAMRRAQCVLATGRAALEAAACGTPVVICDHRSSYQGPLAAPFGLSQARQNYSGRGGFAPCPESMRRMIEDAMPAEGWRQYVQTHHDVRNIAQQLLGAA